MKAPLTAPHSIVAAGRAAALILALAVSGLGLFAFPAHAAAAPMDPAAATPAAAPASIDPLVPSGPGMHNAAATAAADASPMSVTPGMHWIDGIPNMNAWFIDCITGMPSYNVSYDGWYAHTDANGNADGTFPRVGDVYYMHVVAAVIGMPCSDGDVPNIQVQLPVNTELAIDSSNPLYCWFMADGGQPTNVSSNPGCLVGTGAVLPIWLGYYSIPSYGTYEVQFPVRTSAPLDGITDPDSWLYNVNTWAIARYDPGSRVWAADNIYVPPAAATVDTTITSKPASSTTSTSATFSFTSNAAGALFSCKLDTGSWGVCTSPKSYSGLSQGQHTFQVAATDSAGHPDTTPASYTWTITAPPVQTATHFAVSGLASAIAAGTPGSITVTAKDASEATATGYRGTIHFASSDPNGILPANYTFTAADAGVHTFSAGVTFQTAGPQSVTATDIVTASITGTQSGIVVNPAAAAMLLVVAPASWTAGSAQSVTITARDAYGNNATGYRGTVHFTSSDPIAVLPANYTFTAADAGVHTFASGVTLKTAGTQSITATDTVTATITGTLSGIVVTPVASPATTLVVSGFPNPDVAGSARNVTVTAKDASGATASGYRGTIHFTSSDPIAGLPADYTFTAADAGVHTFYSGVTMNSGVTLKTAGTQSITATDTVTATITGTQSGIVVNGGAAATLSVVAPKPWNVGSATNVTVTARDIFGNTAAGYLGTVHFTSSDWSAVLPANYTFTAADAGVHTFAGGLTFRTQGTQSLTAADTVTATITGTQSGIVGNAAPAATALAVSGLPNPYTAGAAQSVTVTAKDASGATAVAYRGTIHFTSSDPNAVLPADYTFTAADNGVHTFASGAVLKTVGTQSIGATDTITAAITGTQTGIVVKADVARAFVVSGYPNPDSAGGSHSFSVRAVDGCGNTVNGYTGTVHFASSDAKAVLPADYVFTAGDAGVHQFTAALKTAGTQSISATDTVTATITGAQTGIVVRPGAAKSFVVTTATTWTAGGAHSLYVTAKDAYGNTATGYRGTIHLASTDAQAALGADYAFTSTDRGVHKFSVTLKTAGTQSISATDTVTATITGAQAGIAVRAAAAKSFVVTTATTWTAGGAHSLYVIAKDAYGNTAIGYRGTIHFTSSDAQAGLPADYTFTSTDRGVHKFTVTLRTAGTQWIRATDTVTATITGAQTGIAVS